MVYVLFLESVFRLLVEMLHALFSGPFALDYWLILHVCSSRPMAACFLLRLIWVVFVAHGNGPCIWLIHVDMGFAEDS